MNIDLRSLGEAIWVSDGASGTELQKMGLRTGECPELWNAEKPDCIRRLARSYVEAGSQIILTNTFGGNAFRLKRHGLHERVHELNVRAAELVREEAGDAACVFGSIGPTGEMLMMGEVPPEEVRGAFASQARALEEAGVDAIAIETMSDLGEATIALQAVKEATSRPVVACMSYDSGPDQTCTMMGVTAVQAAEKLTELGADAVGANCGVGIERYVTICEKLRSGTSLPLWIKPNNGLPEKQGDKVVYRQTVGDFLSYVPRLVEAGANIIGGCCGTTPDHIRGIKDTLGPRAGCS